MASTRTAGTEETGELAADEERITPEIRALADEVGRLYPAVFRRFHVSRRAVPGSDVTPRMLGALQHLAAAGPLTAGELVHHLRLSKAATTELVDRLEQRGLVARMHDERDRRRVFIWLTDEGQARASAHPRLLADDELARALARMRPDDRTRLVDGLRALLAAAAADVPEPESAEEQHP